MKELQAKEIVEKVLKHAGLDLKVELDTADDEWLFLQVGEDFSIGLGELLDTGNVSLTLWERISQTRQEPEDVNEKVLLASTDLVQAILRIINEHHAVILQNAWDYADHLVDETVEA